MISDSISFQESPGCQLNVILKAYVRSVKYLIENGMYKMDTTEEVPMTKAKIRQQMLVSSIITFFFILSRQIK